MREIERGGGNLALGALGELDDFIEPAEAHERQRVIHRVAGALGVVLAGLDRPRALAVHRRGVEQHVQVVIRIDREAFAGVGLQIRMPRFGIGLDGIAPAADFIPGMRRHVVDVAGAGNGLAEILRARLGQVGLHRGLGGVHIQMAGAGMLGIDLQAPIRARRAAA